MGTPLDVRLNKRLVETHFFPGSYFFPPNTLRPPYPTTRVVRTARTHTHTGSSSESVKHQVSSTSRKNPFAAISSILVYLLQVPFCVVHEFYDSCVYAVFATWKHNSFVHFKPPSFVRQYKLCHEANKEKTVCPHDSVIESLNKLTMKQHLTTINSTK